VLGSGQNGHPNFIHSPPPPVEASGPPPPGPGPSVLAEVADGAQQRAPIPHPHPLSKSTLVSTILIKAILGIPKTHWKGISGENMNDESTRDEIVGYLRAKWKAVIKLDLALMSIDLSFLVVPPLVDFKVPGNAAASSDALVPLTNASILCCMMSIATALALTQQYTRKDLHDVFDHLRAADGSRVTTKLLIKGSLPCALFRCALVLFAFSLLIFCYDTYNVGQIVLFSIVLVSATALVWWVWGVESKILAGLPK